MKLDTHSAGQIRSAGRAKLASNHALRGTLRGALAALMLVGAVSSGSVLARGISIEIAPPIPRVEVIPTQRAGYTWAPGYWGWQSNKHVWVNGHSMRSRKGYDWAPDRWNSVGNRHEYEAGHWTRHS